MTSNPSATSSSQERMAAPWPAASGSKLRTTFVVKRRKSWAWAAVSAVPHEATTGAALRLENLSKVEIALDQDHVPQLAGSTAFDRFNP